MNTFYEDFILGNIICAALSIVLGEASLNISPHKPRTPIYRHPHDSTVPVRKLT